MIRSVYQRNGRLPIITQVPDSGSTSPASGPATGFPMTLMVAPGVICSTESFQAALEAPIPVNNAAGHRVGLIFQLHFFFEDLFPNRLGKPLVEWF